MLIDFLYNATVLLTYLDEVDIDEVFGACYYTGMTLEKILTTKCGTTMQTISWLLNFSNSGSPYKSNGVENIHFDKNKAYTFELRGVSDKKLTTKTSHCFILINNGRDWLLIDSYIGEREFSCKTVDLEKTIGILCELGSKFSHDLWSKFTSSVYSEDDTTKMETLVHEYDYSLSKIKQRFLELVDRAKTRLNKESIGIDDSYLSLLSPSLSVEDANSYLSSFDR